MQQNSTNISFGNKHYLYFISLNLSVLYVNKRFKQKFWITIKPRFI